MARSQKLGHCICNPAFPCPCPTLLNSNVCPCAGERAPRKPGDTALTRHVRKAGCASKIGQADLLEILGHLPEASDPRVIVGTAAGDDAGVFKLDDRRALVQTVDVFTPCVDDPYLFGQIAAANSLSDVYAMGGTPLTALSIIGFPIDSLDGSIMEEMLRGGIDKLEEARCALMGGHSINDEEIKCGFAVTGLIDLDAVVERDRAQAGDMLILTKPLGTGMIAFGAQLGLINQECLAEAGEWMAMLNKDAAELMVKYGAHACTDVTGYGLAGHLVAMIRGSGVSAEVDLSAVPVFAMTPQCIARELFSGAVDRNQAYAMSLVKVDTGNGGTSGLPVFFDPQTSGGLLIAIPEQEGKAFLMEMWERGNRATSIIGRIVPKTPGQVTGEIRVVNARLENLIGTVTSEPARGNASQHSEPKEPAMTPESEPEALSCCDHLPQVDAPPPEAAALDTFKRFLREANRPGLIDARNKKLMTIALAIAHHCEPCLRIHLEAAREMGISKGEMDEAAILAVSFGGCTSMMFYQEICKQLGL
ncbi:MAG: selenide, water dikinase SelD [Candidatus Hydrogenedentes bacterium]|nr:selenide, water dikinase SelD [Candidatus Hydrogenedentota bacterium]